MTITDRLSDLTILRDLALARLAAGYSRETDALLASVAEELTDWLKTNPELTDYAGRRLDRQIRELTDLVLIPAPDMADLPATEAAWVQGMLATVSVEAVIPATVATLAASTLVQGATLGAWFAKLETDTRFNIERTVKNGVALGRTNAQLARDVVGIISQGDKGAEPLKVTRRNATAIVRTATNTLANQARLATFEANSDVLAGVEWISVLDSRVSDRCKALDGKVWTFPDYTPRGHNIAWQGGPPAHWACRSSIVPITKTFREMGIDKDELPEGTRASAYGQVSAGTDMATWMKRQPREMVDDMLGKGKADLFLSGKITLTQLVDPKTLRPLTLSELRAKYN